MHSQGIRGVKPGWTRVGFNYFVSETTFQYVLEAVRMVAEEGWKLLPQYRFNPLTGEWHHIRANPETVFGLEDLSYEGGCLSFRHPHRRASEKALAGYLAKARRVFARAAKDAGPLLEQGPIWDHGTESLRWFPLPGEAAARLYRETSGAGRKGQSPGPTGKGESPSLRG